MSSNTTQSRNTYLEQIKRMREASINDENPLAAAFKKLGIDARVNNECGARENRRDGDVIITRKFPGANGQTLGSYQGIESQVSRRYEHFSYTAAKIGAFTGAWVYLACLERGQKDNMDMYIVSEAGDEPEEIELGMIHVILSREELEGVLKKRPSGVYPSRDKEYFTINPPALSNCQTAVFSDTLDGVVALLVKSKHW